MQRQLGMYLVQQLVNCIFQILRDRRDLLRNIHAPIPPNPLTDGRRVRINNNDSSLLPVTLAEKVRNEKRQEAVLRAKLTTNNNKVLGMR